MHQVEALDRALAATFENLEITNGEILDQDPRTLAWTYVALVEVMLSRHAERTYENVDDKLDCIESLFFSGCAAAQGESNHDQTRV